VWYRRAADTGSPHAMRALANWLASIGQAQEAEHWVRRAGQTGKPDAL
jgi:TPR repeat protein